MRLALTWVALAAVATAASGRCTMTGYGAFDCEVVVDGGSLAFELPDGQTFAFALVSEGKGTGYLRAADARPGQFPKILGNFQAVEGKPGCWSGGRDDLTFCAAVAQ